MGLSFLNLLWATNTIKESIPTAESIAKAILDEQEMRKMEKEAYWSAWDMEVKRKVIERLRNHEEGFKFHRAIYPNMTQDEQADLIENGEWRIIAPIGKEGNLCAIWADENREEAQNPAYVEKLKEYKNNIASRGDRLIY